MRISIGNMIKAIVYERGNWVTKEFKNEIWASHYWNCQIGKIGLTRWESCDGIIVNHIFLGKAAVYEDDSYDGSPAKILKNIKREIWEEIIKKEYSTLKCKDPTTFQTSKLINLIK